MTSHDAQAVLNLTKAIEKLKAHHRLLDEQSALGWPFLIRDGQHINFKMSKADMLDNLNDQIDEAERQIAALVQCES